MALPLTDMQQKIYDTLTGDATLMALIEGVFDAVPDDQDLPYVTIGEDDFEGWGAKDTDGFEGDVTLHAWSESLGRKECKEIMERIYDLLQNLDFGITGQKTIKMDLGFSEVLEDPDGRTYHGVMRFDFILGG